MSKTFISIFRDSAFFFKIAFMEILNPKSIALEAWARERSLSQKYQTSLCTTFILTFFGNVIQSTACFRASKLEDQSAFNISLNSETFD
jgi:hypothetical protein